MAQILPSGPGTEHKDVDAQAAVDMAEKLPGKNGNASAVDMETVEAEAVEAEAPVNGVVVDEQKAAPAPPRAVLQPGLRLGLRPGLSR